MVLGCRELLHGPQDINLCCGLKLNWATTDLQVSKSARNPLLLRAPTKLPLPPAALPLQGTHGSLLFFPWFRQKNKNGRVPV